MTEEIMMRVIKRCLIKSRLLIMLPMLPMLSMMIVPFTMFAMLTSCASFYNTTTIASDKTPTYMRPVKVDNDFDISGRFSIKSDTSHRYGNFDWVRINSTEELSFNSPLGQTVAKITIINGVATLVTDERTYTSSDLESMMQEKLGFILPLAYLHYWIQGVALPNAPDTKPLPDGFTQLGWNIEYLKWLDANHPQVIQLTHERLIIKLSIDS